MSRALAAIAVVALALGCEGPPSRGMSDAAPPMPRPDAAPADAAPPDAAPADASGACTTPDDCDDGNPCTADLCDPWLGCVHEPADAGGC